MPQLHIDEQSRLPTRGPFDLPVPQPELNIRMNQRGFITGKPNSDFDQVFKTPFFVPKVGEVKDVFRRTQSAPDPVVLRAAQYQSKVSRDAIEALHAVEGEKARQAFFDEMDKNNIFPRRGRSVPINGTTI